jgi:hypothetical protein
MEKPRMLTTLTRTLSHNPIARAESEHLARLYAANGSGWRRFIVPVTVISGLGIAGLIFLERGGVFDVNDRAFTYYVVIVLATIALYAHFRAIVHISSMAGESVLREKRGATWESLVLTGMDARQVIVGKWWAVVKSCWPTVAVAIAIRMVPTLLFGVLIFSSSFGLFPQQADPVTAAPLKVAVGVALVIPFMVLNMLFTAAAGVTASVLSDRNTLHGMAGAQAARLATIVAAILLLMLPTAYISLVVVSGPNDNSPVLVFIAGWLLTMLDNGSIVATSVANPYDGHTVPYLLSACASLLTYAGLTAILLTLGTMAARRQGAA